MSTDAPWLHLFLKKNIHLRDMNNCSCSNICSIWVLSIHVYMHSGIRLSKQRKQVIRLISVAPWKAWKSILCLRGGLYYLLKSSVCRMKVSKVCSGTPVFKNVRLDRNAIITLYCRCSVIIQDQTKSDAPAN